MEQYQSWNARIRGTYTSLHEIRDGMWPTEKWPYYVTSIKRQHLPPSSLYAHHPTPRQAPKWENLIVSILRCNQRTIKFMQAPIHFTFKRFARKMSAISQLLLLAFILWSWSIPVTGHGVSWGMSCLSIILCSLFRIFWITAVRFLKFCVCRSNKTRLRRVSSWSDIFILGPLRVPIKDRLTTKYRQLKRYL